MAALLRYTFMQPLLIHTATFLSSNIVAATSLFGTYTSGFSDYSSVFITTPAAEVWGGAESGTAR